jgi:hypothetical protein
MNSCLASRTAFVLVMGIVWFLGQPAEAQSQSRQLVLTHSKDEPVEIISITLDGVEIKPGDRVSADDKWPSRMIITIKNVSDKPISWVQIEAFIKRNETEAEFDATYEFRNNGLLQVNETATLTGRDSLEGVTTNNPMKLQIQRVEWNNDPSVRWSMGRMFKRDSKGGYVPENDPVARYQLPREFQRTKRVLYQVGFCTHKQTWEGNLNCSVKPLSL